MGFRYRRFFIGVVTLIAMQWGIVSYAKKRIKKSIQHEREALEEIAQEAATLDTVSSAEFETEQKNHQLYDVRILLDEHALHAQGTWCLESTHGFVVRMNGASSEVMCDNTILTIGHKQGALYLNGRRCAKNSIQLIPREEQTITCDDRTYHGSIQIMSYKSSWLLINTVPLEEYIYSVLKTESWPGWPLEVNKAFAITSRTYAIAMMLRANAIKMPYHLRNTNAHQTYQGVHTNTKLWRAVEKTKGVFMGYENKPILAMFDSCCGGVIPAYISDFDFSKAPYLARDYACTYCKRCKIFKWQADYSIAQLERTLKREFPQLNKMRKIEITQKDKAGLTDSIKVVGRKYKESITGKKLYSLLKEVKSFCFDITIKNDTVRISGCGFGHHLGLCQWGAREMVRDGYDYRRILQFYYPGTRFMSLT